MSQLRVASGCSLLTGAGVALAMLGGGCGGAPDGDTFGAGGANSGAGGASGTSSMNGGTGGSIFNGTGSFVGSNGSGNPTGAGGGCGGDVIKAEQVPLDMYIMLDHSGSMGGSAGTVTKWQAVTTALIDFVNQPSAAGIGVGLQFFPIAAGGTTNSCNPADYATPAVPIAPLPGVAPAITQAINATGPSGGTPTIAALQGAIDYARTFATANPTHVVIHVHVTDGNPQACDTNLQNIYNVAAAGYNGTPSIPTYVIGVGTNLTALQGIAMAGGSGMPFLVDASPNAGQQFLDAMNQIRGTVLSCTYTIPTPTQGTFDPKFVNVEYTPGNGGPSQTIGHVDSLAACPPGGMAWYYDSNANPTLIMLCPDTCSVVSVDLMGQINIVLGCETIPA